MVKADIAADLFQRNGVRFVLDFAGRIQHSHHALRACHGLLHIFQQVGQARNRSVEQAEIQQEGNNILHPQPFPVCKITAEANHQDRSQGGDKLHGRMENRADFQRLEHRPDMLEIPFIHLSGLVFLPAERLDFMNT